MRKTLAEVRLELKGEIQTLRSELARQRLAITALQETPSSDLPELSLSISQRIDRLERLRKQADLRAEQRKQAEQNA